MGKFATVKFPNFVMVDSLPNMDHIHELQLIFQEIADEGMKLCETFTVNCFIEKLPPSWEDFKNYLAYKQKALTLANLITRLQNESLKRDKDGQFCTQDANVSEYRNKGKGKARFQKSEPKLVQKSPSSLKRQAQPPMKNKFRGRCGNCGKMGHKSSECRRKAIGKNQSNLTEADLCAVVTEAQMVEENPKTWWYDTGATTHICIDRVMFSTYQKCKSEDHVVMENISQSKIESSGKLC